MRHNQFNLIMVLISLAVSVAILGVGITFAILYICAYYNIALTEHLWLIAIPPAASLLINVLLIELYFKIVHR
jgi:hypothetical protein